MKVKKSGMRNNRRFGNKNGFVFIRSDTWDLDESEVT
jgi:hypothetical protein